jgi:hypothetical protein
MSWECFWTVAQDVGKVAPVITACVALGAAWIALRSIATQKLIARKRAAIDFFLKTETDNYMITAWKAFETARQAVKECNDIRAFAEKETERWAHLRNYLNLHELMAVGVRQQVLDDSVCFDFWRGELFRAYRDCKVAIEHIQTTPGEKGTYVELVALHEQWSKRPKRIEGAG